MAVIYDKNKQGFTLVELMIAVVIIGILAVLALGRINRFQMRSKVAEVHNVISGIHANYEAFSAKWNTFPAASVQPVTAVSSGSRARWGTTGGFNVAGYESYGSTYHNYSVLADNGAEAAKAPTALAYIAGSANGTMGTDISTYPCAIPGNNGCTATNFIVETSAADISIVATGDLDGTGGGTADCVYVASDVFKEIKPRVPVVGSVCGDSVF